MTVNDIAAIIDAEVTSDKQILQWAHNLRQSIYDAIIENRNKEE